MKPQITLGTSVLPGRVAHKIQVQKDMSVVVWKLLRIMNHAEKYYWKAEPDAISHSATAKGIMVSVEERCKLVQSQSLSASVTWKTLLNIFLNIFIFLLLLAK